MSIGKRIKFLRTKQGISIDELATKLGKNRTTIYRYENGDIENLPLDILAPLAKALDTSSAYLMGWTPELDTDNASFYLSFNETYVNHVEMWHNEFGPDPFTEEEHKKLIEYGKFLISLREK